MHCLKIFAPQVRDVPRGGCDGSDASTEIAQDGAAHAVFQLSRTMASATG